MTKLIRIVFIAFFVFAYGLSASAEERIQSFLSKVDVQIDGDYIVTEAITVNAEGQQIRRGIFRDLPRYQNRNGDIIPVRYDILSVTRNGEKEPYAIEKDGNAYRVRIGDADEYLAHKDHTYRIKFEIKDEIRRDTNFDEVYWNVTGNYWRFPIDHAAIEVHMPEGVKLTSQDVFTGHHRDKKKDAIFTQSGNIYTFKSSKPFASGEGMTISLQYAKGIILPEQASTRRYIWWLRNGALILMSLSLLGIVGYYYRSWNKYGRDPAKDPIFARYEPPQDYSAAAASYIYYRSIKGQKALVGTLLSLANKKHISIKSDKRETVLTRLGHNSLEQNKPLDPEEDYLLKKLFPKNRKSPITLNKRPNSSFHVKNQAFKSKLRDDFGSAYYRVNFGYILMGILLSIAAIVVTISQISKISNATLWPLIIGLVILNIVFLILMPAPTKKGQKIRAEIEGFRLFMKTAVKQKLDAVEIGSEAPPPMSVKRYETLLPYAIALGVEEPWSEYFEKVMPAEAKEYQPHWGGSSRDIGISRMTDNMVSNISSGVSRAAPQSSGSSSSGGGGGFSGGGGGGGGGGGW